MDTLDVDTIAYLVNHIVLPPKLPGADDLTASNERALLLTTLEALKKFRGAIEQCQSSLASHVDSVTLTVSNLLDSRDSGGYVSESRIAALLHNMAAGHITGAVPLEIKAQNAGIIISRDEDGIIFELFELAPPNHSVITTKGRLTRSFPTYACRIEVHRFRESGFITTLARAIAKMSSQTAPGFQPLVRKAGRDHAELRDTTHPGLVTDFLTNVISAYGEPIQVEGVWKNTRGEILWSNAYMPWRRSSLWLLVRVTMQLQFSHMTGESDPAKTLYKPFMVYLISHVLDILREHYSQPSSELIYATSAKLSRRLRKVEAHSQFGGFAETWLKSVNKSLIQAHKCIRARWSGIMTTTKDNIDINVLKELRPERDLDLRLPELDGFINNFVSRKRQAAVAPFQPSSRHPPYSPDELPSGFHGTGDYAPFELAEVEKWIERHLTSWIDRNKGEQSTCSSLRQLIEAYHSAASSAYKGLPKNTSIMYLCLLELWIACDQAACHIHPLLLEFDPELRLESLSCLSLPFKSHLARLANVEGYVWRRRSAARPNAPSVFRSFGHALSFAVKYFNQSIPLQKLLTQIENQASSQRADKRCELGKKQANYAALMQKYDESECEYYDVITDDYHEYTKPRHNPRCSKCNYRSEAEAINIRVHEWPLSSIESVAKATLFELQIPSAFGTWRDVTAYLMMNVLGFVRSRDTRPRASYALSRDAHLSFKSLVPADQRIGILSQVKPHRGTHRKLKTGVSTLRDDDVCLDNALQYKYFDNVDGVFTDTLRPTDRISSLCTYYLPARSSHLQQYIQPLVVDIVSPNKVIADLSECPSHMSIEEYKAFGALPLGYSILYANILTQLAVPAVDFARVETQCLILQSIHAAGPASSDGNVARLSHQILSTKSFGEAMIKELESALSRVTENWESWRAVATYVQLALKLLTFTTVSEVRLRCLEFLARARKICLGWLRILRQRIRATENDDQRVELCSRATEVALLCTSTFDVEECNLKDLLSAPSAVSDLIQSSIFAQENKDVTSTEHDFVYRIMLQDWRSVLFRLFPTLQSGILARELEGDINDAVRVSWTGFTPSNHWTVHESPEDYWLVIKCNALIVHFNLLTAKLLVNGLPLARLPEKYTRHHDYVELFHRSQIEVMPTTEPGMELSAKHTYRGCDLSFGMEGHDLLIVAAQDRQKFDLIPSRLLKGYLPSSFVVDHFHWYNHHTGEIEFRLRAEPWSSTNVLWRMKRSGALWRLMNDRVALANVSSHTAQVLAKIFSGLESAAHIHIMLDTSSLSTTIDLPRLRSSFSLEHQKSEIHSRQYRGMVIDPDQRIGTLVGLSSKLVLKHVRGIDERVVLVPDGAVTYQRTAGHVAVQIDPDTTRRVHAYHLDQVLGRVKDSGNLRSRLYLCYLHALTAYCLPDALTGFTGTETALSLLRSAGVRSFILLSKQDIALLETIARLSPERAYYPRNERVMQEINWNESLPSMSQHPEFCVEVDHIFAEVRRMKFFHAKEDYIEPPTLDFVQHDLFERDLTRSSVFHVDGFGGEHYTRRFDQTYQARSRVTDTERGSRAFIAATMILEDEQILHYHVSAETLEQSLRNVHFLDAIIDAPTSLDTGALRFDSKWLDDPSSFLPKMWCSLHKFLSESPHVYNKFDIMMWLSTVAFAESADMELIQTLAAFYRMPKFASVDIPSFTRLYLSKGEDSNLTIIRSLVKNASKSFYSSPEYNLPKLSFETKQTYQRRKQNAFRNNLDQAVRNLADSFKAQWPREQVTRPIVANADIYVDISQATEDVSRSFKEWYGNRRFWQYIRIICTTIEQTSSRCVSVTHNTIVAPTRYALTAEASLSFNMAKIFSLEVPSAPETAVKRSDWPTPPGDLLIDDFLKAEPPKASAAADVLLDNTALKSQPKDHLAMLCDNLQAQAQSERERIYVSELRDSCDSLAILKPKTLSNAIRIDSETVARLTSHLNEWQQYFEQFTLRLEAIVKSSHDIAAHIHLTPRLSPTFWLQQLDHQCYDALHKDWKTIIIDYGLAVTGLHRAQRLLSISGQRYDLAEELLNCGHQNWDPADFPETLLLEAESGIMIRAVQEDIAKQMRQPPDQVNTTMQLNMGEGKSSVIVPIVANALANRSSLVRIIVGKAQSTQMYQMLVSKLGGLLNRRIYPMPFSRALRLSSEEADTIQSIYLECMRNRGIMLVQPEHLLSFKLMGIECLINGDCDTGRSLLHTQQFFDANTRDIVDESDENFSVKFELVYTMGAQRPIELSPDRWAIINTLLGLVARCASKVKEELPSDIEFDDRWQGRHPRIRTLQSAADDMLLDLLAHHICEDGFPGLPITRQPKSERDAIYKYIRHSELSTDDIEAVEKGSFWTDLTRDKLLLIRGLIACGVLRFALGSKRWRVNYGLDPNRLPATKLAVPFRSKDSPTPRSEFSHPDVIIAFTSLTYYYGGLSDEELFDSFDHLLKSDQAEIEYEHWVRSSGLFPFAFRLLSGVNIKDKYQCSTQVFPALRYSKGAIDYFLSHIVFPKELKEFPYKLSASGWDIGQTKPKPTTGFSGTNDSRHVLPLTVDHLDLPQQKHTNALVLSYLLQNENCVKLLPPRLESATSDAAHLLSTVMAMELPTRVILDVGAQILELDNGQVAKKWLEMSDMKTTKAVVFFAEEELSVLDRNGRIEPLQTSPFAKQLDACLVYLDEAHTRGTDLKLPRTYRAAVTLGANVTKDRLVQACMRMRKLGKGQSVVFIVSEEIQNKILERTTKRAAYQIDVSDVLQWAILETWADLRRSMPLWATQGRRFEDHKNLLNGRDTTIEDAQSFLEDEAQTLEHRYRPRSNALQHQGWDTSNPSIARIIDRCQDFETVNFNCAALHEEQERELSPEIEEERQVQRPASMEPAEHELHQDLVRLVETGVFVTNPQVFVPAFQALGTTSAAAHFPLTEFPTELFVTVDYIRTVLSPLIYEKPGQISFTKDSYLRPVQWVMSIPSPDLDATIARLVILGPFEADKLLAKIHTFSKVTLHLYAPCCNLAYKPLDKLQLYSIGRHAEPGSIPRSLTVQLNLFAGQLYLRSYAEYVELCEFLGLAWTAAKDGQTVEADGFVTPPIGKWGLTKSPIQFLRAWLTKIRREGEGIEKTHLGRILDGELLQEIDFEQLG